MSSHRTLFKVGQDLIEHHDGEYQRFFAGGIYRTCSSLQAIEIPGDSCTLHSVPGMSFIQPEPSSDLQNIPSRNALARSTTLAKRQRRRSEASTAPLTSSTNIPSPDSFDTSGPLYATDGASQSKILQPIRERTTSACQNAIPPLSFHISSQQDPVFIAFSSSLSMNTKLANTCITMSLCGQVFTYNLQCLESDPREIIELLKVTASDKGNWVLVGAYYRRMGNPVAAITVMTTMLEEMSKNQVPDADLKPAFLFLASCELELRKRIKQEDAVSAAQHSQNAQKWLQKVYGTSSDTSDEMVESGKPPVPVARQAVSQSQSKPLSLPKNMKNKSYNNSLSDPRQHAKLPPRPPGPHQKILEREIDSLRDRQAMQASILSEVRSCKRQLEDDIIYERDTRRRMERELDALRRERDSARRIRSETDARRRMEEIVDRERQLRRETEGRLYISGHSNSNLALDG
ncbi:uncharacterized protein EV420DRAFT_1530897 [Desarmillaria tabescens]|uniref:Uncharacterized protein n=1 Tax=Armillaria tabescens TaxID=1929756 RepID=A0AA39N8Z4_ARMTA|nr:uncharacterized protein EV420DRAFT_1530897 [Desarmillaria tabescens]KAK0461209.1 hypothetical protein EV420DRAFT_1530897 [Desarmillaria tabescens]